MKKCMGFRWAMHACIAVLLFACATKREQVSPPTQPREVAPALNPERAPKPRVSLPDSQLRWANQLVTHIRENWLRPPQGSVPEVFNCTISLRLAPDGSVSNEVITKSCGSELLDLSVLAAIRQASPLPLPEDPQDFVPNLQVTFCPSPTTCQ